MRIALERDPQYEHLVFLHEKMKEAMAAEFGPLNFQQLIVTTSDSSGSLVGGLSGTTFWKRLAIDMLWVSEEHRRMGYASAMLKIAEEEAVRRGCVLAELDTFNPAAVRLYERNGYALVTTIDAPRTPSYFGLVKTLRPVGRATAEVAGAAQSHA